MRGSLFALQEDNSMYLAWRQAKLRDYPNNIKELTVDIKNPYALSADEKEMLLSGLQRTNWVLYQLPSDYPTDKNVLRALGEQLGLHRIDKTLCAESDGITALQVAAQGSNAQDYIPYSNRALNWHTDGYYNQLDQNVQAILLHCMIPAHAGGENQLYDHEIAYLHLRDVEPAYISALMQPDAMTIPANIQNGQTIRPAQSGPVFSITSSGHLHMRYTARQRNIVWKQDVTLLAALEKLTDLLNTASLWCATHKLAANQGLLCNNVLHNRSGFNDVADSARLLYRIRYYDRVEGS